MGKKPISFSIDEEIINSIEKKAKEEDRSMSFIVNEILKKEFSK